MSDFGVWQTLSCSFTSTFFQNDWRKSVKELVICLGSLSDRRSKHQISSTFKKRQFLVSRSDSAFFTPLTLQPSSNIPSLALLLHRSKLSFTIIFYNRRKWVSVIYWLSFWPTVAQCDKLVEDNPFLLWFGVFFRKGCNAKLFLYFVFGKKNCRFLAALIWMLTGKSWQVAYREKCAAVVQRRNARLDSRLGKAGRLKAVFGQSSFRVCWELWRQWFLCSCVSKLLSIVVGFYEFLFLFVLPT